MVFVYILQSLLDGKYYVGITKDLNKRLEKHNRGTVESTKKRKPFKMVYSESFQNYTYARSREKEIKSYKGGNEFRKLLV